jgi:hypothetical protein
MRTRFVCNCGNDFELEGFAAEAICYRCHGVVRPELHPISLTEDSRRWEIAKSAMEGILAHPSTARPYNREAILEDAVGFADGLLEELAKPR